MAASAPVGPWDIEGEIEHVQWIGGSQSPAQPMMSGSLGGDRTFPAHYWVTLRVTRMTPSPSAQPGGGIEPTMTRYDPPFVPSVTPSSWRSRLMNFIRRRPAPPQRSAPKIRVATLQLPHPQNDGFLQTGMYIRVTEYCELGDEGGIWTSFQTLTIQSPAPPSGVLD
jgi:hypothetical protein